MFRVIRSTVYSEKISRLDSSEINRVIKFEQKLKEEQYSGKPLGYRFIREKKFNGKRLLFIVYEEFNVIFLVTITNKKEQQSEINQIKTNLEFYKKEVEEIIKISKPL